MFAFIHEKTQPDKVIIRRNIDPADIVSVAAYGGTTCGVNYREKGANILFSAEVLESPNEMSFWRSFTDINTVSPMSPAVVSLTAAALGANQAAATLFTKYFTIATTATATTAEGFRLPAAVIDDVKVLRNDTDVALKVYPATGEKINGAAVNVFVTVAPGETVSFYTKENAALGYFALR